jgi:FkbM family methyltransferase
MAYDDTFSHRLGILIKNPSKGARKIVPFIKSRLFPYQRNFYEKIGLFSLSKPYVGHDDLLNHINFKNGFFVQCGGNDGYGNDPTYFLEKKLGWKGIIVEPLPIYKLCQKNRKASTVFTSAVGSFDEKEKTVDFIDCNAMSFVKNSIDNESEWIEGGERTQKIKARMITVPIHPVQVLIDDYFSKNNARKIDFFVADVEGYELAVIKGLDFKKNSPTWLLLEIHTDERRDQIEAYLKEIGYGRIAVIGHNDYLFKIRST